MSTRHRKIRALLWSIAVLVLVGSTAFVWLLTVPAPLESWLQNRVLQALREHYHADVQLQNLRVTLVPVFRASGDNFVLPNRGRVDLPPLITVKHFEVIAAPFQLLRTPVHLSWLRLDGLKIQVAPKRDHRQPMANQPQHHTRLANFVIDRVEADETQLYVQRKRSCQGADGVGHQQLRLRSAGIGQPMKFRAQLTNPTPPGVIETSGHFGPWNFDEPSATAVDGHYDFQHADLSALNGISGILSSAGDYRGSLHNIVVDGNTDIPDFQLDSGGEAVHLTTTFHAIVDGTNGNTYLQPVDAHFLKSHVSVLKGEVASKAGEKGKTISLDVDMRDARVQDVLALASKSKPPMLTGHLKLQASLLLPPGKQTVLQKMVVDGRFQVSDAKFTDDKIRNALTGLSRRGLGKPNDPNIQEAPAEFAGDFLLRNAKLDFHKLQFTLPGVTAQMKGSYALASEQLDFAGDVRLDARVSQTMTGAKRVILVPFDPIFSKHGAGTYLPLNVAGTRSQPQIKLDLKKLF